MLLCLVVHQLVQAQDNESLTEPATGAMEQLAERAGLNETELQTTEDVQYELAGETIRKLDLNQADEWRLSRLPGITPNQARSIAAYRRQLGGFTNVFELQNVPGMDETTIRLLLPFVSVQVNTMLPLRQLLREGEQQWWLRYGRRLETADGYRASARRSEPYYTGSPDQLLLRYRYTVPGQLSLSLVAEKDAGEPFMKGINRYGFDFYGGHAWLRNRKCLKELVIGDFNLQMGQGLVCWQSWSPGKGSGSVMISRSASVLKGYTGVNELNFLRGAACTLGLGNVEWTTAASCRLLDATVDSVTGMGSVSASGYHRSVNEQARKQQVGLQTYTTSLVWQQKGYKIGLHALGNFFNASSATATAPYQYFDRPSQHSWHASIDYALFAGSTYWFGEVAWQYPGKVAMVHGLMVPLHARLDLAVQYRQFPKDYVSFWASPFAERTGGNNEAGLYAGLRLKVSRRVTCEGYWDMFQSRWLQYLVDAPAWGHEWQMLWSYRFDKQNVLTARIQYRQKQYNLSDAGTSFYPLVASNRLAARMHYDYELSPKVSGAIRVEYCNYQQGAQQHGFLFYHHISLALPKGRQLQLRTSWFDMDSYDTRIYAYETDVLYGASVPFFYNRGFRYYLNGGTRLTRHLYAWLKLGQTWYFNQPTSGSGYDKINSNHQTDVRVQLRYRWGGQ
jgi:DNA uptake protein ComE-like DNA-binding protein